VENKIIPVALGKKNYLFAGSHDAAQQAAMINFFGYLQNDSCGDSELAQDHIRKKPRLQSEPAPSPAPQASGNS